jgi:hypothetical protein
LITTGFQEKKVAYICSLLIFICPLILHPNCIYPFFVCEGSCLMASHLRGPTSSERKRDEGEREGGGRKKAGQIQTE